MAAVTLTLDVDEGEPIAGWIELVDGVRRRFEGMLELVALLENARGRREPLAAGEHAS
jgi:hypothetical protein